MKRPNDKKTRTADKNLKNKGSRMPYLAERFEAAVSTLVSEGSVKERLAMAYSEHLDDLESGELPQALRDRFDELHAALHAVTPTGNEHCVRATIRKMSPIQARQHARTILALYSELALRGERTEPLQVVAGKRKKAPRFVSQGR
ncbi:MAG TPA: hypothetical protein VIV14_10375 [Gammaproteobacteria bacterium]